VHSWRGLCLALFATAYSRPFGYTLLAARFHAFATSHEKAGQRISAVLRLGSHHGGRLGGLPPNLDGEETLRATSETFPLDIQCCTVWI
jgi:hypothetical protein